jgi:general secretion pathway protein A
LVEDAIESQPCEVAEAEGPPIAKVPISPAASIEPVVRAPVEPRPFGDAFALTPDPEFFYPSLRHREALASLEYGITSRKGFVMLLGDSGMGKTMLLECLSDRLKAAGIEYGFLFNSRLSGQELFELLAIDFDLAPSSHSKTAVLIALNHYLLQRATRGQTTALLIDDAQKLNGEVLEEIELLSNLETRKGKQLQVVMAARPEFEKRMDQPELAGMRQRFVLRPRLGPLSATETAEYIHARLDRTGTIGIASTLPIEEIHRLSCGIPRLINAICGQLLERRGGSRSDSQAALTEVADELGLIA